MWTRLISLLLCVPFLAGPVGASSLLGTRIGVSREVGLLSSSGSLTAYAMAANDAGWDARFTANSTLDVLAITVSWATVSVPGVVSIRVETDDGTGKPSGTPYDANATLTAQVPAAGTQTYTFVTPPTTTLTIGSLYHILIITTTLGTTMTLNSSLAPSTPSSTPTNVLTTATATTRNTFAVVANTMPVIVLTRTGPIIQSSELNFFPFTALVTNNVFGTTAAAAKIVTVGTLSVVGYVVDNVVITGTPAGDLRFRLLDASDAVVSGSTVTVDKDAISVSLRSIKVPISPSISLPAGTYRIVMDSASSANSSNCYNPRSATSMNASAVQNATQSTTTDITATPIVWTDSTTNVLPAALLIDTLTIPAPAASARGIIGG